MLSVSEAAKIQGVTRHAICAAIKSKNLRAIKETTRWAIDSADLIEFNKNKYSREKSQFRGEIIFDKEKGFYSIKQIANLLGLGYQVIYYNIKIGRIDAHQMGSAWVIHVSNAVDFFHKRKRG